MLLWREAVNHYAYSYRAVIDTLCNQSLDAYIYQNMVINDGQCAKQKKLTLAGPGTKALPAVDASDQFIQPYNLTLNIPRPPKLEQRHVVSLVTRYTAWQPWTYIAQQRPGYRTYGTVNLECMHQGILYTREQIM
jgi:hypothetical protein